MKLINSEGRIFGKVNIIDAMVLFTIAFIIWMAYVAYGFITIPNEPNSEKYIRYRGSVYLIKGPKPYAAINIKVDTFRKIIADYEKAKTDAVKYEVAYTKLQKQVNKLISEHRRLKKYFE